MKKLTKILFLLLIASVSIALSSCSSGSTYYEDNQDWWSNNSDGNADSDAQYLKNLANTLRGHWEGAMRYEFNDDNGQRAIAQFNAQLEFDQYDATGLKGRGREIDTATSNGNTQSQTLYFTWKLDKTTSDIYVTYDGSKKKYRITMLDKTSNMQSYLDANRFEGTMIGVNNNEFIDFKLARYSYAKSNDIVFSRASQTRAAGIKIENKIVKR